MSTQSDGLEPEQLQFYLPFSRLDEDQLILISAAATIEKKDPGKALFRAGDDDKLEYFLVSGSLNLTAKDGAIRKVVAGEELARHPVARLRPRQYTAIAAEPIRYFSMDKRILDLIADDVSPAQELYEIDDADLVSVGGSGSLLESLQGKLMDSTTWLRSHPAMVANLGAVLSASDDVLLHSTVPYLDPVLSYKLANAANSPVLVNVRGQSAQHDNFDLQPATLRRLAAYYGEQVLADTESSLSHQLMGQCRRSVEVAALCGEVAKFLEFEDGSSAMLAGLFHNIGTVLLLQYALHRTDLQANSELIAELIQESAQVLGAWSLEQRHFPAELVDAIIDCRDYGHKPDKAASLTDVLSLALVVEGIARRDPGIPKRLDGLPILALLGDDFGPQDMLGILQRAREQATSWHNQGRN